MSDKISVCLVSANSYPLFNEDCNASFGGAELQVFLLAKHLAQDENYFVSVIVGDFGQGDNEVRYNVRLVKAHRRNGRAIDRLFAPFKLFRAISKGHPDVIIQRASGPETGICAFYARIKKVKFIYSVAHDAELVGESVAAHHPVYRRLYEYGVKRADIIVVQSQDQMRSLARLNKKLSSKAVVITNSIEVKSSPSGKREHILWIARAQIWKRPEIFIDLAKEIQDEHFVMVMPFGEETDDVRNYLEKVDATPNIEFIASVDFHSSQELFNKAKILINTSSWEGFPNTFLQAGIAAIPIVSLEVDPDSFIKTNRCGYVCEGDFSKLLKNVRLLLKSKEEWEDAGRNCYEYVVKNHDIQMNIEDWKMLICDSDLYH